MKRSMAVIGGDLRQVYLARLLAEDGWDVVTWGLEQGNALCPAPLHVALTREILIFPLPVCKNGRLHLPLTDTGLPEEHLWPHLRGKQLLLGGMTEELSPRLQAEFGLTMLDYYAREELQVANAVPTVLALRHKETPRPVCLERTGRADQPIICRRKHTLPAGGGDSPS